MRKRKKLLVTALTLVVSLTVMPSVIGEAGGQITPRQEAGLTEKTPQTLPPVQKQSPVSLIPKPAAPQQTKTAGQPGPVRQTVNRQPPPATETSGGYRLEVIINSQRMKVYHHDILINEWPVSTGINDTTPVGRFTIENRGRWFFSEKYQEGGRWWVSFLGRGRYLFHGVPTDRQNQIIESEAGKLGRPASHGCVRLATDQAKWIYDHIPSGTPVDIHR